MSAFSILAPHRGTTFALEMSSLTWHKLFFKDISSRVWIIITSYIHYNKRNNKHLGILIASPSPPLDVEKCNRQDEENDSQSTQVKIGISETALRRWLFLDAIYLLRRRHNKIIVNQQKAKINGLASRTTNSSLVGWLERDNRSYCIILRYD